MGPEAPESEQASSEQEEEIGLRFEMQEHLVQVGELLDRLPDAPDKKMLRHVLEAAQRIIFPNVGRDAAWADKSRTLKKELEKAMTELRRLVDDGV